MINVLGNAIFPILLMATIGALLGRIVTVDVRSIGRLALFVFSPALIFAYLYDAEIPSVDVINILIRNLFIGKHWLFFRCWVLKEPLSGDAERGGGKASGSGSVGAKQALIAVTKMPTFYAVIAALVLNILDLGLPSAISTPVDLLADAAIPTMVIVLGIQLTNVSLKDDLLAAGVASIVRLIVSPVLALGATLILGIDGITQQVLIVLAGMPTAVYTTILATEFQTRPKQVTSAVASSTLLSIITVTTLVWLTQNYF